MNILNRQLQSILRFIPIFIAAFLFGCGGGSGGGGTAPIAAVHITGTAAAGAPVVGYVSVRDSSTHVQPVKTNIPIEANGNYSVDVTGLTAPYAFLATGTVGGKTISLYSAATSADEGKTINITPFTDLIIRNIAATTVDTYLAGGGMSSLTAAELDAKRVALTAQLAPALTAMGLSGSIDLLRATFNADSTGLDRFMDVVKVDTTVPSAVTITNILDAATTLVIDTTSSQTTIATSGGGLSTTGLTTGATPIDNMMATGNAFSAFFATGLPSTSDPALLALFSDTFVDDGRGSSAFLTEITTNSDTIGMKFNNGVVDSVDLTAGIAVMHFSPVNAAGISLANDKAGGAISWQMKRNATTGVWQMDGNQRIARVSVETSAMHNICNAAVNGCNWTSFYATGLHLEINDRGLRGIGSALVTGPGLPVGGVTLVAQINQNWFNIITSNPNNSCVNCTGNEWKMSDTDIASVMPNSSYTVQLYDNATTPALLATYTEVVPVAPVLNTAVAGLAYPSLSGMVNLAGTGASSVPLTWTIPAGMLGDWINVWLNQTGTNENLNVDANTLTATGTATLVISAPTTGTWTYSGYSVNARDQYGGRVSTNYQY